MTLPHWEAAAAGGTSGDRRNRVRNFRLVQHHLQLAALLPGAAFPYSADSSSWMARRLGPRRFGGAGDVRSRNRCQRALFPTVMPNLFGDSCVTFGPSPP